MVDQNQVLKLSVAAGEVLLRNGGEISRVQETMERIAQAYQVQEIHVYVLTNGIFASVGSEKMQVGSAVRHVPESSIHFERIVQINALSREIHQGKWTPEAALQRVDEIRQAPCTDAKLQVLFSAVGAACFAYLFGGTAADAAAGCICGFVLQFGVRYFQRHAITKIMRNIMLSALMALCGVIITQLFLAMGIACTLDYVIIGSVTPLVPGVALTNSIRDFTAGDYLSGAIRMLDALLIASSIALGVGFVLKISAWLLGGAL